MSNDKVIFLSIEEVTRSFDITQEFIIELIEEGVLSVPNTPAETWRFDEVALCRIRTVLRLERDLNINLPGAALAIELLEKINKLEQSIDD